MIKEAPILEFDEQVSNLFESSIYRLILEFNEVFPRPEDRDSVLIVPISPKGVIVGERLGEKDMISVQPIEFSESSDNNGNVTLQCTKALSNIYPLVLGRTKHIAFTEFLVEDSKRLHAAINLIQNQLDGWGEIDIQFSTFALVSKIPEDEYSETTIPNLHAAFYLPPMI